ncbi:OmpH family outer membrane protein [Deinococcus sp. MIMF12]|uniref:OmpH family outer membrane protein n=1 Tax=Deinococcus rhizophilus TaxID=3049544 RepID=A0ABT7JLJ7_9DEIO|nr:OmpH family outer membrane protein [Deinococcus rhizophilus]MDL2344813.1 OmpH family outer membrane protein [Deinococcus rhizophilus]
MKITAKALAPVALVAAFGLGTLAPQAQTTPQKVGFVDVQTIMNAQPVGKELTDLRKKAETELSGLEKQIRDIDAKGAQASAAEKDRRTQLVGTLQARAKAYDTQIQGMQARVTAAEKAADTAISTVAKSNGYSIVMDRRVAATSGLVVFAENGTDLTDAAVKAIK